MIFTVYNFLSFNRQLGKKKLNCFLGHLKKKNRCGSVFLFLFRHKTDAGTFFF